MADEGYMVVKLEVEAEDSAAEEELPAGPSSTAFDEGEEGEAVELEVQLVRRSGGRQEKREQQLDVREGGAEGGAPRAQKEEDEEEEDAQYTAVSANFKVDEPGAAGKVPEGKYVEDADDEEEEEATLRSKSAPRSSSLTEEEAARLEAYERKLRRNTREALELVDRLCELQQGTPDARPERPTLPRPQPHAEAERKSSVQQRRGSAEDAVAAVRAALAEGVHALGKTDGNNSMPSAVELGEGMDLDVESVSVNGRLLHSPTDCVLLPGHLLLVVDAELGLQVLSLRTRKLVQSVPPPADGSWRGAHCACLGSSGSGTAQDDVVYVLLDYREDGSSSSSKRAVTAKAVNAAGKNGGSGKNRHLHRLIPPEAFERKKRAAGSGKNGLTSVTEEEEETEKKEEEKENEKKEEEQIANDEVQYERAICRFSLPDMRLIDRIEAPIWLREQVVTGCRLCFVPQTQCLYLAANTPNQGFLFELRTAGGKWTECAGTRRHRNYSDLHPFAVVGPVTELLLVETNRCYVQLASVYGSNIVSDRMLGMCERPGALCVDERGNLFVFDRAASKVGFYSRTFLEKIGDVALVERAHCRLSARDGVLAVLCGLTRELRLHRYSEAQFRAEQMPMPLGGMPPPSSCDTQTHTHATEQAEEGGTAPLKMPTKAMPTLAAERSKEC